MRVGIPTELKKAMTKKKKATDQPFVEILLAAARKYREQTPLKKETRGAIARRSKVEK